jgi:hypothetical protein
MRAPMMIRDWSLIELARFGRDVFRNRVRKPLLLLQFTIVGQGEIDAERERPLLAEQTPEDGLGFAHLVFGQIKLAQAAAAGGERWSASAPQVR